MDSQAGRLPLSSAPGPGAKRLHFPWLFASTVLLVVGALAVRYPLGPEGQVMNAGDGSVLVYVPAGSFVMGSKDGEEHETPLRRVRLPAFWIGTFEVTNDQFSRFVEATGYDAGTKWRDFATDWGGDAPVVCVSWDDASAYCRWAGLRLPTEEEWEKAARGPDGRIYPWGDAWDPSRAWFRENSGGRARPVGLQPRGASVYGVQDTVGNVWEWTSSPYAGYPGSRYVSDAYGKGFMVFRGGGWHGRPNLLRAAYRFRESPNVRFANLGFRCARSADPESHSSGSQRDHRRRPSSQSPASRVP